LDDATLEKVITNLKDQERAIGGLLPNESIAFSSAIEKNLAQGTSSVALPPTAPPRFRGFGRCLKPYAGPPPPFLWNELYTCGLQGFLNLPKRVCRTAYF